MNNLPKARTNKVVVQEVDQETLVYDLSTDKIYALNETSGFIWKQCDGKKSVDEIVRRTNQHFRTRVGEDFVWLALENLWKERLLEAEIQLPDLFKNTSRRQMIKKIGLTSMIALPFVTSFLAPRAANAQSGNSVVCVANAQGCQPTNNLDLFVYTFMGNPTPFCQFSDPDCQTICDASISQCCSCNTVLLPDTINAAFVCRCA